jgi:stearoyl-CoA desaturase (delta-9 desaturase)
MALLLPRATAEHFRLPTAIGSVFVHLVALTAPFVFTWPAVALCAVFYYLTGCWGITFNYHRLLTHKSFKANKLVTYLTAFIGCMALQGGPLWWTAHHRLHHRESDKEMDPHSPKESFLWSHMLWFHFDHPKLRTHEQVCAMVPDLAKDPVLRFMDKHFILISIVANLTIAGVSWLVWDAWTALSVFIWVGYVRTVIVWHCTWLVNSATHVWGYKTYESGDDSLNNWFVALLTFGEGWHNNHHAKQRVARSGHQWWEVDITYHVIAAFRAIGWVWDVVPLPSERAVYSKPVTVAQQAVTTKKSTTPPTTKKEPALSAR